MDNIQILLNEHIKTNYNNINIYLLHLGLSHQHMHNESFIFTSNQLNKNLVNFKTIIIIMNIYIIILN